MQSITIIFSSVRLRHQGNIIIFPLQLQTADKTVANFFQRTKNHTACNELIAAPSERAFACRLLTAAADSVALINRQPFG